MSGIRKVLVVDDEATILRACDRILGEEGVEAVCVGGCAAALSHIAVGDVDAIVLDLMMPGMSGLEFLRMIREKGSNLPVVVITGYATPEVIRECRELGAAQWLAKPFTPDELWAALRAAVGK